MNDAPRDGRKRLRLCMVTTFYPPYHFGGDALFVRALARALVQAGHEVDVVHCEDAYRLRGKPPAVEHDADDGVVVHKLRSPLGALSPLLTQQLGRPALKASSLRNVFNLPFDVVNFHNISLIGGPGVLPMSTAPVTLYTVHEHWLICPTHILWKNRRGPCDGPDCFSCSVRSGIPPQIWRYTGAVERGLAHVDALLAPSAFTARQHRGVAANVPVHVLPTFTDIDPGRAGPWQVDQPSRFLFVGRVTASKGIELLLTECAAAGLELDVVGDGDLREALQKRYAAHTQIRFFGAVPQDRLVGMYQRATAMVLPSLAPEVFPLTVLEAMACGTPVIAHEAGGSAEALERTGGGIVYRSQDELRSALRTMGENRALRESMARRARAGFEQHYTRAHYLARYLALIDQIAGRKRAMVVQ
jgi:glycosyltransferase involved in cell wall biosynthesis